MFDLIYLAYNRRAYTELSWKYLIENTGWESINRVVVYDDGSEDGTDQWLEEQVKVFNRRNNPPATFHRTRFNSPVATMLHYIDNFDSDAFIKIDSDFVVCPGWLQIIKKTAYLNPGVDVIGFAPNIGPPTLIGPRELEPASHIGGIGLIRRRVFKFCRPVPRGRFGWTEFQQRHDDISTAWLKPDMPVFEIDKLPFDPWASLADQYEKLGWSRSWGKYPEEFSAYWNWAFQK